MGNGKQNEDENEPQLNQLLSQSNIIDIKCTFRSFGFTLNGEVYG